MNSTRKTLLSLCAALLLTFGVYACKSTSDQSSVNNGTQAGSTVSQNTTGDMNTAGLNNSTGAYVGGSGVPAQADQPTSLDASSRVGGRENVQAATADNSYAGTGQTLITSKGTKTTTTTTYATPTVVTTAPVVPNTTETITTTEVTPPTVTETTTTTTETVPMVSSVQETTTTTTPAETTTHTRMHKD
ncbi:MAG TPA: hypothetical protein VK504_08795 [Vicinamibacterales bacterium]|nr:hypothetical protein [Vicinamibacterales bacterium]